MAAGKRLITAAREAAAIARGEAEAGSIFHRTSPSVGAGNIVNLTGRSTDPRRGASDVQKSE